MSLPFETGSVLVLVCQAIFVLFQKRLDLQKFRCRDDVFCPAWQYLCAVETASKSDADITTINNRITDFIAHLPISKVCISSATPPPLRSTSGCHGREHSESGI